MATIKGTLEDGVEIGGKLAKEFELREATAGDMFDAEEVAKADRPVAYEGALISRQLVMLGDIPGPIDFDIIRRLTPDDFHLLSDKLRELEGLGKPKSKGEKVGSN